MASGTVMRTVARGAKGASSARGPRGTGVRVCCSAAGRRDGRAGGGAGARAAAGETRRAAILRGLVGLSGAAAAAGVQAPRPALALLEQDEDLELLEKIRAKKQVRLSVEAQQGASGGECPRRRARTGDELRA